MERASADRNLAGYCGLYCGGCDIYRLHKDSVESGRKAEWAELPERLRKNLPFKPSEIVCQGCRSDVVFGGCRWCPMRACARKRADVTFCTDCSRYPCFRFKVFRVIAWLTSLEKKLPHQKSKRINLERIRCVGMETWLAEQEQEWRCPDCQTRFSWYSSTCGKCGRELESLKAYHRASKR